MTSDFAKNLEHLFNESGCRTRGEFASRLGIDRTRVSRLLNGKDEATKSERVRIAEVFDLEVSQLYSYNDHFMKAIGNLGVKRFIDAKKLHVLDDFIRITSKESAKYRGQYNLYYSGTDPDICIASLVTIGKKFNNGLEFEMINPYEFADGSYGAFEYKGIMYISEFAIYVIAEQTKKDYELLNLIFYTSPLSEVKVLKGIISGIGVKHEQRFVAANSAVLLKRASPIRSWKEKLGSELGYVRRESLPELIRRNLDSQKIIVE